MTDDLRSMQAGLFAKLGNISYRPAVNIHKPRPLGTAHRSWSLRSQIGFAVAHPAAETNRVTVIRHCPDRSLLTPRSAGPWCGTGVPGRGASASR